jgi:hypothetical protein
MMAAARIGAHFIISRWAESCDAEASLASRGIPIAEAGDPIRGFVNERKDASDKKVRSGALIE